MHFWIIIAVVCMSAAQVSTGMCLQDGMALVHKDEGTYWNGYVRANEYNAIDVRASELARRCGLHATDHCRQCAALQHQPSPYPLVHALIYYHALKLTYQIQESDSPTLDTFYAREKSIEAYGSARWGLIVLKHIIERDSIQVRIKKGEWNVLVWPSCTESDYERYYLYTIADSTLTKDSSTYKLFQQMREQYAREQTKLNLRIER